MMERWLAEIEGIQTNQSRMQHAQAVREFSETQTASCTVDKIDRRAAGNRQRYAPHKRRIAKHFESKDRFPIIHVAMANKTRICRGKSMARPRRFHSAK